MRTLNKLLQIAPKWFDENINHHMTSVELIQVVQVGDTIHTLSVDTDIDEYTITSFSANRENVWHVDPDNIINEDTMDEWVGVADYFELESVEDVANYVFISLFAGEWM